MKYIFATILIFCCVLSFHSQNLDKVVDESIQSSKRKYLKPYSKDSRIDTSYIVKREFNTDKINEYKSSDDFVYEKKEEEPGILQRFWNWIKESVKDLLRHLFDDIDPAVGVLSNILRALPYILLVIGLFFIIKYFVSISPKTILEGKNESLVNFSDDEELLQRDDLETLLSEAIANSNYRLAIRFYYLQVLKKLSDASIIDWQQQKTNRDYILEVSQKHYKEDFIESTRMYDFIWYGKFELSREEFEISSKKMKLLIRKIV